MRVGVYADNTLPIAVGPLCNVLNSLCTQVCFVPGTEMFRLMTASIHSPTSANLLTSRLRAESEGFDLTCLATSVPYENNFFFESLGKHVIISFSGWNTLTDLPISNGLVYFVALLILRNLGIGAAHDDATGCINDFQWDKSGVDVGMRAAFVCRECLANILNYDTTTNATSDVQAILDFLSRASRAHRDVLAVAVEGATALDDGFDVFLCHNTADKPAVAAVNQVLVRGGLKTWLDEEQLPLGIPWQAVLEREVAQVKSAAVFVGKSGIGPWQDVELRAFLDEFVSRTCPVIPVLLPDAPAAPQLPIFLKQMSWLDLRRDYDDNLRRFISALRKV